MFNSSSQQAWCALLLLSSNRQNASIRQWNNCSPFRHCVSRNGITRTNTHAHAHTNYPAHGWNIFVVLWLSLNPFIRIIGLNTLAHCNKTHKLYEFSPKIGPLTLAKKTVVAWNFSGRDKVKLWNVFVAVGVFHLNFFFFLFNAVVVVAVVIFLKQKYTHTKHVNHRSRFAIIRKVCALQQICFKNQTEMSRDVMGQKRTNRIGSRNNRIKCDFVNQMFEGCNNNGRRLKKGEPFHIHLVHFFSKKKKKWWKALKILHEWYIVLLIYHCAVLPVDVLWLLLFFMKNNLIWQNDNFSAGKLQQSHGFLPLQYFSPKLNWTQTPEMPQKNTKKTKN